MQSLIYCGQGCQSLAQPLQETSEKLKVPPLCVYSSINEIFTSNKDIIPHYLLHTIHKQTRNGSNLEDL